MIRLRPCTDGAGAAHFPAIIANNTVHADLKAMLCFINAGVAYHRGDQPEKSGHTPPATWTEMTEIAHDVKAKARAAGNDKI